MVGEFLVFDTPGHTIGSKSFYHKYSKILMAGDTLFYHSYGRFDLPTGSQHQLVESLKKLCSLPEDTIVYNGHTEETTRSEEHTSELQSRQYLVCRLLLEKKKKQYGRKE